MVSSSSSPRQGLPAWVSAASRVEFDGTYVPTGSGNERSKKTVLDHDFSLSFAERAFSAAGAAVLSAVLVNPLDVSKTRLQAQAAGVPYNGMCPMACFETNTMLPDMRCSPSCTRAVLGTETACAQDCSHYKGTIDVFYKVTRQEGLSRLWRGTNASLALAVPTVGIYLPCYDTFRNYMEEYTSQNAPSMTPYVPLVAGLIARSLACITCYPVELARTRMQVRRRILGLMGEGANATSVIMANFSAGFVAGSLAAAATCPLDVAKTRRQIEKDSVRALQMTTKQTLVEIWRDGGIKGLFTGVGPRVGRAGPSVGIVVSFYEIVKYTLHRRHTKADE
ncbi:hypothetical protein RJ639_015467 [Escallonia herrerae]|uniref:Mitochondrial carrier protein n=1 Tax=Escallonia herrerae TaxID=1293975 RepID=A0AA88VDU7_9ASTE|nr:hypothetical protein RJ639_015467 [Escallonia herrerae]